MKAFRIILSITLLFFFCACTKFGKNVTVKGRVMNPITGQGIEGAEVKLLKVVGGYDSNYKTIESSITDATGSFEMSKFTLSSPVARCGVDSDGFYRLGWTKDGGQTFIDNFELNVKKGKVINADFYAVPYGNYKLIINNINCQGSNDTIIINQTNQVNSFLGIDWILTGCSGYTTAMEKAPMGTVFTHYKVIQNGFSTEYDVNFEILPNQDNIQTINY